MSSIPYRHQLYRISYRYGVERVVDIDFPATDDIDAATQFGAWLASRRAKTVASELRESLTATLSKLTIARWDALSQAFPWASEPFAFAENGGPMRFVGDADGGEA